MAFAFDTYTATAAQVDFTITFTYRIEADVEVYKNGTLQVQGAGNDYTIVSTTIARFNSGLTSGDVVWLIRNSGQSARIVDYANASNLIEDDLDNDSIQAFRMAQEALDQAERSLQKGAEETWDAAGLTITEVAEPVAAQHAATKNYVDEIMVEAGAVPGTDETQDGYVLTSAEDTWSWAVLSITGATLADNSVDEEHIVDESVTGAKIASGSITATQMAAASIGESQLANEAVNTAELATGAVTAAKIAALTITEAQLATASVTAAKIENGTITATEIATGAVGNAQIVDNAVDEEHIATGAVTGAEIADTTINEEHFVSQAVSGEQFLLDTAEALQSRNAGGTADVDLILLDAGDETVVSAGEGGNVIITNHEGEIGLVVDPVEGVDDYLSVTTATGAVTFATLGTSTNVDMVLEAKGATGEIVVAEPAEFLDVVEAASAVIVGGNIRIPNNTSIQARNAANTAYSTIIVVDGSDNTLLRAGEGGIFAMQTHEAETMFSVSGVSAVDDRIDITNATGNVTARSLGTSTDIDFTLEAKGLGEIVVAEPLEVLGNTEITGTLTSSGEMFVGANEVFHAGNFSATSETTKTGSVDVEAASPTTVELIESIASEPDTVNIHIFDISTNSANTAPLLQLADAVGGLQTTGYVSEVMSGEAAAADSATAGFLLCDEADMDAAELLHTTISLVNMGNNVWSCTSHAILEGANEGSFMQIGSVTLEGALTDVTLTTEAGTATFDGAATARSSYL